MIIYVDGEKKELIAFGKNDIEYTNDLLKNYDAVHFDEENDRYTMNSDEFEWWDKIIEMINKITDIANELNDTELDVMEQQGFQFHNDLETRIYSMYNYLIDMKKGMK